MISLMIRLNIILMFIVTFRFFDPSFFRNKIYRGIYRYILYLHAIFCLQKQKRQKNNVGKQRDRLIRRDAIHAD